MTKSFFRIAFFFLGIWLAYLFGNDMQKTIRYKIGGVSVTGRIEGFLAGRNSTTVQTDNSGVRRGKRKARRPVYRYPTTSNATDSLSASKGSGVLFFVFQYEMDEKVNVVFPKDNPSDAYIFNFASLFGSLLPLLFSIYMIKIGVTGRL
jgi:hypothetical protein